MTRRLTRRNFRQQFGFGARIGYDVQLPCFGGDCRVWRVTSIGRIFVTLQPHLTAYEYRELAGYPRYPALGCRIENP